MPVGANVPYAPTAGVTPSEGVANDTNENHANAAEFGGQVGEAEQKLGDTGLQIADQFGRMAVETQVDNDFANKYSQQAGQLRANFDKLSDADKVAGSVAYMNGLHQLGSSFVGDDSQASPLYKQAMGQLINRHVYSETMSVDSATTEAAMKAAGEAKSNLIAANNGYAAQNYNNPNVIDQTVNSNLGLTTLQHMNVGHDPTNPDSAAMISAAHDTITANMADGMVSRALQSGDVASAMKIRGSFSSVIPGYQQLQMDNILHTASMQQSGVAGVNALASGQTIPESVGSPPVQVQSLVANAAHTSGVDPNDALAVLRIESSNGQNLGNNPARATLGQDKESAGQPLDVQAQKLCENWKNAKQYASQALGRDPQGWEQYTVYQQGAGGGAALLKADPNANAVSVLSGVYDNPKDALAAIAKNGGGVNAATMTVSDFLNQEKQRYNDSYQRAHCDFSGDTAPGDQIAVAHQTAGIPVQPAANPIADYENWQKANETNLNQIMQIPGGPLREATLRANKEKSDVLETQANAYRSDLMQQAYKLMADKSITSMSDPRIPPQLAATLFQYNPVGYETLQNRIAENAKKGDPLAKESEEMGPAFHQLNVGMESGSATPTTIDMANDAYNKGLITNTAHDYLLKDLMNPKKVDPDEAVYQSQAEDYAKASMMYDKTMPESIAAYSKFKMAFDNYVQNAKGQPNANLHEIYDLSSGKAIDKMVQQFQPKSYDLLPSAAPAQHESLLRSLFAPSAPIPIGAQPIARQNLIVGRQYSSPTYGTMVWNGNGFVKPGAK